MPPQNPQQPKPDVRQGPDGKYYEFEREASQTPEQYELQIGHFFNSVKPKQGSAGSRAFAGVVDEANPFSMIYGVGQAVVHPWDTVKSLASNVVNEGKEAYGAAKRGDVLDTIRHANSMNPLAKDISDQVMSGDMAGGIGKAAIRIPMMLSPKAATTGRAKGALQTGGSKAFEMASDIGAPEVRKAILNADAGTLTKSNSVGLARSEPMRVAAASRQNGKFASGKPGTPLAGERGAAAAHETAVTERLAKPSAVDMTKTLARVLGPGFAGYELGGHTGAAIGAAAGIASKPLPLSYIGQKIYNIGGKSNNRFADALRVALLAEMEGREAAKR